MPHQRGGQSRQVCGLRRRPRAQPTMLRAGQANWVSVNKPLVPAPGELAEERHSAASPAAGAFCKVNASPLGFGLVSQNSDMFTASLTWSTRVCECQVCAEALRPSTPDRPVLASGDEGLGRESLDDMVTAFGELGA